jgi:6-phosphogluconate dehydrogenase
VLQIAINCSGRKRPIFFRAAPRRPDPAKCACRVLDSGQLGPTVMAAIEESVPRAVESAALYKRLGSRGDGDLTGKVLSARRYKFGGREEKAAARQGAV